MANGASLTTAEGSARDSRTGLRPGFTGRCNAVRCACWQLAVFLVGLFLDGNGQAANLLASCAATDLAESMSAVGR